jgi:hypothetical protein
MAEVEGARRGGANVRARRGSTAFVRHHAVALPIERSHVGVANEHGVPTYVRTALRSREYCCDCSAAYAHYAKPIDYRAVRLSCTKARTSPCTTPKTSAPAAATFIRSAPAAATFIRSAPAAATFIRSAPAVAAVAVHALEPRTTCKAGRRRRRR